MIFCLFALYCCCCCIFVYFFLVLTSFCVMQLMNWVCWLKWKTIKKISNRVPFQLGACDTIPKRNEWTFLRSFENILRSHFFLDSWMSFPIDKKANKKDYLLLCFFLVCNDIASLAIKVWWKNVCKEKKINWNWVIESKIVIKNATRMTSHKNISFSRELHVSPIKKTGHFFILFINMVHSTDKI